MSRKSIFVPATLDAKGREAEFLRQQIEAFGDQAVLVDAGVTVGGIKSGAGRP
jgi:uncharacterized protein (UPF0261 family)